MRYSELKAKRPQILAAMREWEAKYYDGEVNYLQLQADSGTITVHNAVATITPRARFTNKMTFSTWGDRVCFTRRVVRTDPVYLNDIAVERLRLALETAVFDYEE